MRTPPANTARVEVSSNRPVGCAGDGFWYNALRDSVSENQPGRIIRTFRWGLPLPLYMMNLQDQRVHAVALFQAMDRLAAA